MYSCANLNLLHWRAPVLKLIFGHAGMVEDKLRQYSRRIKVYTKLDAVPEVDIDEGVFKYVLMKVIGQKKANTGLPSKLVVRGYKDCRCHSDIYGRACTLCQELGLNTECLGGGRMEHDRSIKSIKVYGYSQGFGKADHSITKDILLKKYRDYNIETSYYGY